MNRKQAVLQRRNLLTIALVTFLSTCIITKVHGMSAIVQSYEESTYMEMKNHQIAELFRCKIHLSIETENDGSWRNNTEYRGYVRIVLDWYDTSLFPSGVSLLIHCPIMAAYGDYLNQTPTYPYQVNQTLSSYFWGHTSFDFKFKTEELSHGIPVQQRIDPEMSYHVYNGSTLSDLTSLGSQDWVLPPFWITIMQDSQQLRQLQEQLQGDSSNLQIQLDSLRNLMYVIILTTTVLVATTVYIAVRKPKIKSELKTT